MNLVRFLFHLITIIIKLSRRGGVKAIAAENLLLKQQLITLNRNQKRSPKLKVSDRFIYGILSSWINPKRLLKSAIIIKPNTLLRFHKALVERKYHILFTNKPKKKPGPKGPSNDVIKLIIEMKRRNPRFGHMKDSLWSVDLFRCESIRLRSHWVMIVMDQYTRRIIGFAVHVGHVEGISLCRMFNKIINNKTLPSYLSSDHDPLFNRWKANLRVSANFQPSCI